MTTLDRSGVEEVYDAIADAIDAAGPRHAQLFLAKLALLLAHACGDAAAVKEAISTAGRDLGDPVAPGPHRPAGTEGNREP